MRLVLCLVAAMVVAGCSDAPEPLDAAVAEPVDVPEPTFEVRTVLATEQTVWDGRTKEGAFVCSDAQGTGSCSAGQQVQPDGRHTTNVTYAGNLTTLWVDMTWSPADPSQTGLVLAVYHRSTLVGTARGTDGLNLTVQAPALPPDDALTLIVWPEGKTETQPSVFVDATRQDFTATVTVQTAHDERVQATP